MRNNDLMSIAYKLKKDHNKNVNSHFNGIEEITEAYFEEDVESLSNNLFVDKMTILKDEFGITKNLPLNAKIRDTQIENPNRNSMSISSEIKNSLIVISEDKKDLTEEKEIKVDTAEQTKESSGIDVDNIESINHIENQDHLEEVDITEKNKLNSEDI